MSAQLVFDGLGEAELYHRSPGRGYFAVLWREMGEEEPRQRSYPVVDMGKIIPMLPRDRDTWLSQAEFFRRNRRLVNLSSIALQFVDVDYYHSRYAGLSRDVVIYTMIRALEDAGVPLPSIILDSGRGLQAKWMLEAALPRQALPRWNAVQSHLVDALADFGADARAKDGSRVLRLVDTVNTRSGTRVEVAFTTASPSTGELIRYDFDSLADLVLPFTRSELAALKAARLEAKVARIERQQLRLVPGGLYGLRRLGDRQLAWDRLEDIRTLSRLRGWAGGNPAGHRDVFLFWATNFAALGGVEPRHLHREAVELAKEFAPTWSHREAQAAVGTVVRKAKEMAAGERVEYNGRKYPPLYTPRNSTLMCQLQVTPEEERQLQTIITKDEKRRRDRERDTGRRRSRNEIERGAYLGRASDRRSEARRMRQEGLTQREIAARLGVTQQAVSVYLRG